MHRKNERVEQRMNLLKGDVRAVKEKKRDYLFDNIKGILIFGVVFAHFLEIHDGYMTNLILSSLYSVMVSFLMPVFTFISGYFTYSLSSDIVTSGRKAVQTALIPFLVWNFIYWVIGSRNLSTFFVPQFAMWFLLALFIWKTLIVPISQIRFSLIISFIFSLYIGLTSADKFMSLHRAFAFFPYFVAGYLFRSKRIHSEEGTLIKYSNNIRGGHTSLFAYGDSMPLFSTDDLSSGFPQHFYEYALNDLCNEFTL